MIDELHGTLRKENEGIGLKNCGDDTCHDGGNY